MLHARLAVLALVLFVPGFVVGESATTGPWDVKALQTTPIKPEWGTDNGKVREVFYSGEPFKGKPTRVFAYYAKPAGEGPFPAVVLVHGGGGKAFNAWAEHWAARGYCALAMDLAGNGPTGRLADGGPDQSDDTKFGEFDDKTVRDMWTYHAVAAVLRSHTLLASFPEVDKDRAAVTGISWGGYLTCIVAGLDHRFKAAVPVYGCGFLHDNSVWKPRLDGFPAGRRDQWVKTFDPSIYLPGVKCPILFLNGTNDFAYPLDSYRKCFELVKAPKTLSIHERLPHGHIWTFSEVDAFIDSHIKKGTKLPTISAMTVKGDTASASVTGELKSANLHFAIASGPWPKREWKPRAAELTESKTSATIPADRPIVFYLSVTDERGLTVSTPHMEIAGDTGKK
ncbi:MAG TPA: alpha/beta fold hydrolase [Gemmataceae bacterium]|jgi:dienelactone hydrolase|nr:alpha/beta fold hydrolase [Gemmataceae bacterium]